MCWEKKKKAALDVQVAVAHEFTLRPLDMATSSHYCTKKGTFRTLLQAQNMYRKLKGCEKSKSEGSPLELLLQYGNVILIFSSLPGRQARGGEEPSRTDQWW